MVLAWDAAEEVFDEWFRGVGEQVMAHFGEADDDVGVLLEDWYRIAKKNVIIGAFEAAKKFRHINRGVRALMEAGAMFNHRQRQRPTTEPAHPGNPRIHYGQLNGRLPAADAKFARMRAVVPVSSAVGGAWDAYCSVAGTAAHKDKTADAFWRWFVASCPDEEAEPRRQLARAAAMFIAILPSSAVLESAFSVAGAVRCGYITRIHADTIVGRAFLRVNKGFREAFVGGANPTDEYLIAGLQPAGAGAAGAGAPAGAGAAAGAGAGAGAGAQP